jgi:hypothetical protein
MTIIERLREFAKQDEPTDPDILLCPFVAIRKTELLFLIEVVEAAKECFADYSGQDEVGRLLEALDQLEAEA